MDEEGLVSEYPSSSIWDIFWESGLMKAFDRTSKEQEICFLTTDLWNAWIPLNMRRSVMKYIYTIKIIKEPDAYCNNSDGPSVCFIMDPREWSIK